MPQNEPQASPQTRETIAFLTLAATELASIRDLKALSVTLHRIIREVVAVEFSGIFFLDTDTGAFRLFDSLGFAPEELQEVERTAMQRHPGHVLRTGQMLHVPDVEADTQRQTQDTRRKVRVRSRLFIPFLSEGRCVGTIGLASAQPNSFTELHIAVLQFAGQLAGVVYKNVADSSELRRQMEHIAHQEQELRRLSSPVIEVWERVLALPLIGRMSQQRFELVAENLLQATVAKRAKKVILDLTGIETLEDADTKLLLRLCSAVELLGCRCLLSGISPIVAQSLALSGQSLVKLQTHATLRQALAAAMVGTK